MEVEYELSPEERSLMLRLMDEQEDRNELASAWKEHFERDAKEAVESSQIESYRINLYECVKRWAERKEPNYGISY